ncbi:Gp37-like protein [Salipaludibacillus sp. CF4.18]|uniref:Gp37-like protein n=1 Tax=Salipaludibacillus sp. CF4.18 TaxID=3373081 RepID=UPI003EE692FC
MPCPIEIEFNGPATNPNVANLTTGEFIRVNRELFEGDKLIINTAFGNERKVVIVDQDGKEKSEWGYIDIWESTYEDEFESFVSHLQPTFKQTKKTEMVGPFVYEKDYNLGDITTQMNREWGVIVDQRITEFTEVYEASGFGLEVIFGQKRPTLITKIKDEFKQYENELKR